MKKKIGFSLGIIICLVLLYIVMNQNEKITTFTNTDFAMGTVISQTIYGTDEDITSQVIKRLREIENKTLSWRTEGSEVELINRQADKGTAIPMSKELSSWIIKLLELSESTEGVIDPSVGPLTGLWDIGGENERIPSTKEIKDILPQIDYKKLIVTDGEIRFTQKGQKLDFGAFGKGIGSDEVKILLDNNKTTKAAIVSVGGSILVYGKKPGNTNWKVGIQDPRPDKNKKGEVLGTLSIDDTSYISTSGDYEQYFIQNKKRYHHILNPHTGYPSNSGLLSVTILCDSGLISDALSTACFILGYEKSLPILQTYNAKAIFVKEDKSIILSNGMEDHFELTQKGYHIDSSYE